MDRQAPPPRLRHSDLEVANASAIVAGVSCPFFFALLCLLPGTPTSFDLKPPSLRMVYLQCSRSGKEIKMHFCVIEVRTVIDVQVSKNWVLRVRMTAPIISRFFAHLSTDTNPVLKTVWTLTEWAPTKIQKSGCRLLRGTDVPFTPTVCVWKPATTGIQDLRAAGAKHTTSK